MDDKYGPSISQQVADLAVKQRIPTREIVKRFPQVSEGGIRSLVSLAWKAAGEEPPRYPRATTTDKPTAPLSLEHQRVGRRLSLEASRRDLPHAVALARVSGLGTAHRLKALQKGLCDPTLSELQRIAKFCNVSVPDLLKGDVVICHPKP